MAMGVALKFEDMADLAPLTLTVPGLDEKGFLQWCERFPDCLLEYSAEGELSIMPPTEDDTSDRNAEIIRQLGNWAIGDGRGKARGSSGGFRFPDGSRLSPDAAWVSIDRKKSSRQPGVAFPVMVPEFIIELKSSSDRVNKLAEKMEVFIANGVKLGWLLDPYKRTVTIYRPRRKPETLLNPKTVKGEGPVAGFVLDLEPIWNLD